MIIITIIINALQMIIMAPSFISSNYGNYVAMHDTLDRLRALPPQATAAMLALD